MTIPATWTLFGKDNVLNRLLVLATRIEPRTNTAIPAMQELIESEFAKLARRGIFSFTN